MIIIRTLACLLLLIIFHSSCESDAAPEEEASLDRPETVEVITAPKSIPEPVKRSEAPPEIEEVLDTTPAVTRAERPKRSPAMIRFAKTSYNYDSIQQGAIIEYAFKFKNTGERPLSIKDVKGSCGCTIGSYPFLDIAPGESSEIKARFDSKGKVGPQFTTITVYSNANAKGDVLSLKGVVLEPSE